jgi:hypothetical protein
MRWRDRLVALVCLAPCAVGCVAVRRRSLFAGVDLIVGNVVGPAVSDSGQVWVEKVAERNVVGSFKNIGIAEFAKEVHNVFTFGQSIYPGLIINGLRHGSEENPLVRHEHAGTWPIRVFGCVVVGPEWLSASKRNTARSSMYVKRWRLSGINKPVCYSGPFIGLEAYGVRFQETQPRPLIQTTIFNTGVEGSLSVLTAGYARSPRFRNRVHGFTGKPIGIADHRIRLVSSALSAALHFGKGIVHFSQLASGRGPLQQAHSDTTQREEGHGPGKPYHPFFGRAKTILKALYLSLLAAICFGLCVSASWVIWRFWNRWAIIVAFALYGVCGFLVFHLFEGLF